MTQKQCRRAKSIGTAAVATQQTVSASDNQYNGYFVENKRERRSFPVRRSDGRIVGRVVGDTLRKRAKSEHMLREPAGWAWDTAILDAAERAGVRFTEIEFNGQIYRATLADFRRYGFPVDRRHGDQRGLALIHWGVRRVGEAPAAVQLSLFGGG